MPDGLVHKPEPYPVSIKHRGFEFEQIVRRALVGAETDILNFDDVEFEAEPYWRYWWELLKYEMQRCDSEETGLVIHNIFQKLCR